MVEFKDTNAILGVCFSCSSTNNCLTLICTGNTTLCQYLIMQQ